ncbi:MAG: hypothetical protein JJU05_02560 [Verrucomicrobia bacterium]|nr:hypothetical protein [Verrucomicrobiota bacterium]MCH8526887.1 hypothetical protein [Kiritimatiellia bacterium]
MKHFFKSLMAASLLGMLAAPLLGAYTPPTDRQLSQALANPGMVRSLIQDANPEEAGQVLVRLLRRIQASDVVPSQKNFLAAYYSARFAFLLGNDADDMAAVVLGNAPAELLPAVWAGFSVGGQGSSSFMAALRELAGENEEFLQAVDAPNIPLGESVYNQLIVSLGSSQTLPPVAPGAVAPAPSVSPIQPAAGTAPAPAPAPPPPIPEPYAGQS